jgi:signal transduction histidine kinase
MQSRMMSLDRLSESERRELDVVDRNARLLYSHVCDLLDVAKIDAGRMRLRYAEVDLASLVHRVAANFDSIAEDLEVCYAVKTPESLNAQLDPERTQRILFNLLANAFKFTPTGGSIRLALGSDGDKATIEVEDSGPGMRDAIFERFRQADAGEERRFGGTGLGLAIVKKFVTLHGGAVEVGAAPGGGARFAVALPRFAPTGAELHPPGPVLCGGRSEMSVQRERRIERSRKSDSKLPGSEREFGMSRFRTYSQIR